MTDEETKETEMIPCMYCGRMCKGAFGLKKHMVKHENEMVDGHISAAQRQDIIEQKRKQRQPIDGLQLQLDWKEKVPNGMRGYIFSDDEKGRIDKALKAGYQFVRDNGVPVPYGSEPDNSDRSTCIRKRVGTKPNGSAKFGYLMVIERELYEEDQERKERNRQKTEQAIKRGEQNPVENQYMPSGTAAVGHHGLIKQTGG